MNNLSEMARARKGSAIAILSLILAAPAAWSQTALSGDEVMSKVFNSPKPVGTVETLSMKVSKGGQSLSRSLTSYSTGDRAKGETEKTLIKFTAPADVKGSGFLTMKKPDGSSESFLWLPALGRVRRLGTSNADQDQAFFGSDFTNRDINGFDESDFAYTVTSFANGLYTVDAAPKRPVGYEKLVYQVDSSIWKYVKIEYWRGGKLVKEQRDEYQPVGAYYLPSRIVMSSATKSQTELSFSDYKIDQKPGDQIFTERFLKQ